MVKANCAYIPGSVGKGGARFGIKTMTFRLKDPFSALSHLTGALLSVAALTVLVTIAAFKGTAWHVVSFSVYGTSMILLYTASTLTTFCRCLKKAPASSNQLII